jgi:hypothetical protein
MPHYDLRLDVPLRAYMNATLLTMAERGGTLLDAKKQYFAANPEQFSDINPYNYSLHDPSLALSLLYCTVVVPREFLDLPANHEIYRDFDLRNITNKFFSTIEPKMDSYLFLRCLRNSVAHALFSVRQQDGEACYDFWTDRNPLLSRASIGHRQLFNFLDVVGRQLTNAVLANKSVPGG